MWCTIAKESYVHQSWKRSAVFVALACWECLLLVITWSARKKIWHVVYFGCSQVFHRRAETVDDIKYDVLLNRNWMLSLFPRGTVIGQRFCVRVKYTDNVCWWCSSAVQLSDLRWAKQKQIKNNNLIGMPTVEYILPQQPSSWIVCIYLSIPSQLGWVALDRSIDCRFLCKRMIWDSCINGHNLLMFCQVRFTSLWHCVMFTLFK